MSSTEEKINSDPFCLHIIYYSDVHGRFLSKNHKKGDKPSLGLDRLSTYVKKLRQNGKNILLIDNGDTIQGTPLVDLHDFNTPSGKKHNHPINIVHDELGVDCFIVGNHEFNFGIRHLNQIRRNSKIPWLAANILKKGSNKTYFEPFRIFKFNGLKIGVLGLVTDYVSRWESTETIQGIEFKNVIDTAQTIIPQLNRKCDFLIVSYHGGLKKNPITNEKWTVVNSNENQALELWELFPEINLLLTGHQHRSLVYQPEKAKKATIIQPSCFAKCWAHIRLTTDTIAKSSLKKTEKTTFTITPKIIDSQDIPPDPIFGKILKPHQKYVDTILNMPLGSVDNSFVINDPLKDVWINKHPLIQWVNNLICETTGIDISGSPLLDSNLKGMKGKIKIKDILRYFFFQDTICVLKINGKILRSALEQAAGFFWLITGENGKKEIDINPDWRRYKILSYNYDMWDGINYGFDIRKPVGNRLVWLKYMKKEIRDNQELYVAVTSFRSGGAFYTMFSPELIVQDFPVKITDLMANDLLKKQHLTINPIQNFKIIY